MTYLDTDILDLITRAEAALADPSAERERVLLMRPLRAAIIALGEPGIGVEAWTRLGLLARLIEVRAQLLESLRETFGV